jgi:hypothetical protein
MSNISTAFNDFKTRLSTLLPNHIGLTNPYASEQNTAGALNLGYGVVLGAGTNTKRLMGCKLSVSRNFNLILTRKYYAQELNITGKETTAKDLFEDQKLIIAYVEKNPTIQSTAIAKMEYDSDNGIEFIFTEKDNYLKLETVFRVEYFETL